MDLLTEIEEAWEAVRKKKTSRELEGFAVALVVLYQLHGEPFGPSAKGMRLWVQYAEGTTSN